ncbi:MAG: hypothetical protein ABII75_09355 [Candidatus Omnitrophota bacterium]
MKIKKERQLDNKASKTLFVCFANLIVLLFTGLAGEKLFAEPREFLYERGRAPIAGTERDFAFIDFYALTQQGPRAPYYKKALFATAEYCFFNADYEAAQEQLLEFVQEHSKDEAVPFALAFMLKLNKEDRVVSEKIMKKLVEFVQLTLLFREFKEHTYVSALGTEYKAKYFIDRIEIYINNELFENICF